MGLEAILEERIREAESVLVSNLQLNDEQKSILNKNKPKIYIIDNSWVDAAYNFLDNAYIFSRDAINTFFAIGEEVAHSIRLRLNKVAKDYFLQPFSKLKENIEEYIERVNLEEYFGRYGALIYANYKGQKKHNSLWSKIEDYIIKSFVAPFEYITHFFGYRKAEADYAISGNIRFKKALYSTNISQLGIPRLQLAA